ncbi:DUF1295 domain-containing protein [uncultured Halopseudomonas sp.]|uniref:DUF1295 domain-containing protein n=1 Tax=uncultured Halopseudomonas sp. TaxID=2901193 RepID=UPI0030EC3EB8|tara:strand:+ start:132568 stop:133479 length:912 start_codon:yes stop_codon:yes gene_type:complete
MKYFSPLLPLALGLVLLLLSDSLRETGLINALLQCVLFALVVCVPTWLTGRMSYVDIGWPWGLVVIGVVVYIYGEGDATRVALVSIAYVFAGGRMGLDALRMWVSGELKTELPRYAYQRRRWEKTGKSNAALAKQVEVISQGAANLSFLAMPALVIASNPQNSISIFEVIGLVLWFVAFAMESIADRQKHAFIRRMKAAGESNKVCNVGLWKYTRHPNYFAEWMVWNALVIAAIPSWLALYDNEALVVWILLGVGLLFASRIMYVTLVYYTGAIPAEYFSVKKRPEYKAYQQTTNMFFPGPKK